MATENNNKNLNVPNLRFPEFSEEWDRIKVSDLLELYPTNSLSWEQLDYSGEGIFNLHYGLIHKGLPTQVDVSENNLPTIKDEYIPKKMSLCQNGDVAFADASEDTNDVAKCIEFSNCEDRKIVCGLHTIHGRDSINKTIVGFKGYAFAAPAFRQQIRRLAQGTKIYSVSSNNFAECYIGIPSKAEQTKIAELLYKLDKRIATQIKIIEDLKKLKSAIRTKVFKQLESNCECWTEIGNMLQYEQPSKYLVASTEYSDSYATPVLTANKAFILGYTDEEFGIYSKGECVIFDDFTMDVKFVNFPFKVKSSAIKILTANSGKDLYFVYEYLQNLGLVSEEHKRHYISEIEPMIVACPTFEEQQNISNLLRSFDSKIECANRELTLYNKQKQYLLSQMFI